MTGLVLSSFSHIQKYHDSSPLTEFFFLSLANLFVRNIVLFGDTTEVSHSQGLFSSRLKETGPSTRMSYTFQVGMRQAPAVGNATWCLEI